MRPSRGAGRSERWEYVNRHRLTARPLARQSEKAGRAGGGVRRKVRGRTRGGVRRKEADGGRPGGAVVRRRRATALEGVQCSSCAPASEPGRVAGRGRRGFGRKQCLLPPDGAPTPLCSGEGRCLQVPSLPFLPRRALPRASCCAPHSWPPTPCSTVRAHPLSALERAPPAHARPPRPALVDDPVPTSQHIESVWTQRGHALSELSRGLAHATMSASSNPSRRARRSARSGRSRGRCLEPDGPGTARRAHYTCPRCTEPPELTQSRAPVHSVPTSLRLGPASRRRPQLGHPSRVHDAQRGRQVEEDVSPLRDARLDRRREVSLSRSPALAVRASARRPSVPSGPCRDAHACLSPAATSPSPTLCLLSRRNPTLLRSAGSSTASSSRSRTEKSRGASTGTTLSRLRSC